jgi:hypothetical protein
MNPLGQPGSQVLALQQAAAGGGAKNVNYQQRFRSGNNQPQSRQNKGQEQSPIGWIWY